MYYEKGKCCFVMFIYFPSFLDYLILTNHIYFICSYNYYMIKIKNYKYR